MPEFERVALNAPDEIAISYVYAVMLFPHDVEAQRATSQAIMAEHYSKQLSAPSSAGISVSATLAAWLYKAPRPGDLPDLPVSRSRKPLLMGMALKLILQAAEHNHPEIASKGKVLRGFSRNFSQLRPGIQGFGIQTLDDTWSHYNCVAHLWACCSHDNLLDALDRRKALLIFLSAAETVRRRGEALVVKGAHAPVLDPRTTWKVPDGFALPAMKVTFSRSLPDDIRMITGKKTQLG